MALISIDFHNTLFQCNDWFRLEVETLPVAFFDWRERAGAEPFNHCLSSAALSAYRDIREAVTASGRESDAVTSLKAVCDRLNLDVGDGEVERGVCELMRSAVRTANPAAGAVELVQYLHAQGHTLAVVSSAAHHPFLEWALDRYGLRGAFTEIVTSASCGIYKSNPDIYRHAIERLGASGDEAIHIGDSYRFDVDTARAAGMRTILLTSEPDTVPDPQPDGAVVSLGDVPAVLDRLLKQQAST